MNVAQIPEIGSNRAHREMHMTISAEQNRTLQARYTRPSFCRFMPDLEQHNLQQNSKLMSHCDRSVISHAGSVYQHCDGPSVITWQVVVPADAAAAA